MHDFEPGDTAPPSKTRRKREMEALQKLGESLLELDAEALAQLALPDELRDALEAARRIHAHGARRRHMQYIGRLMRGIDPAPLEAALQARRRRHDNGTRAFHRLEQLREALITGGDDMLNGVVEEFPRADRQRLRKLARQARAERKDHRPPAAARTLFRYLRELQQDRDTPE